MVINSDDCIGCGSCVDIGSEVFGFDESETRSIVKKRGVGAENCIEEAMESCPAQCIPWSSDKCVICESCIILCSEIFSFNENDEVAEMVLQEGDIEDCIEEEIGSCSAERLNRGESLHLSALTYLRHY